MRGFRLSVAGLAGVVALAALWIAAVMASSNVCLTLATMVTLAVLLSSPFGFMRRRAFDQAFWIGFTLFGWTYFVLVNWDWVGGTVGHALTGGISEAAEWLFPVDPTIEAYNNFPRGPGGQPLRVLPPNFNYSEAARAREMKIGNFMQIARLTASLAFALLGGLIARVRLGQPLENEATAAGLSSTLSPPEGRP